MSSVADERVVSSITSKQRLASVDVLRFMACFGIVWAHGLGAVRPDLAQVGYEALTLFCILMAYYSVKAVENPAHPDATPRDPAHPEPSHRDPAQSTSAKALSHWLLQRRLGRIALPWLFWCGFYLLLEVVISGTVGAALTLEDPLSLLIGPVIHLWFLPFAFIASGLLLLSSRLIDTRRRLVVSCLAAIPFGITLFWLHDRGALPEPFVQWAFAAPGFLFGILVGLGERHRGEIFAWLSFGTVCIVFIAMGTSDWPSHVLFAALVFGAAKLILVPSTPLLKRLGGLALGIYLIHPFHMAVVYKIAGPGLDPVLSACVVFALSAVSVWIMQGLPVLRRVV